MTTNLSYLYAVSDPKMTFVTKLVTALSEFRKNHPGIVANEVHANKNQVQAMVEADLLEYAVKTSELEVNLVPDKSISPNSFLIFVKMPENS